MFIGSPNIQYESFSKTLSGRKKKKYTHKTIKLLDVFRFTAAAPLSREGSVERNRHLPSNTRRLTHTRRELVCVYVFYI